MNPHDDILVQMLVGDAHVPSRAHDTDIGYDLYCAQDFLIGPDGRFDVPIGIAIAVPDSMYGRITGRSSSVRKGLLVHEGIIDPGYRGPLYAYVSNLTNDNITIRKGDRIAQLIFAPALRPGIRTAAALPSSDRGQAGLGSTGA